MDNEIEVTETPEEIKADEVTQDIDDAILSILETQQTQSTETLERVTECQTQLQQLLTRSETPTENLSQAEILQTLRQIQAEVLSLKSFVEATNRNMNAREQNDSETPENLPTPQRDADDHPEAAERPEPETETPPVTRKARFA